MSYTSGFFDAVDLGGGDYDREYSAAVFAHYFSLLVKNGVFPDPSTGMQVKASSSPDMHVSVQPGSGWVNGYYITVPENGPEVLTVPTANPSLSRIDSVIMGLNYVEREIQLYIKSGAVSASPSAVSLQRNNDLYEMELAQITVAAGVASISQANITDMRQNTSRCGIVKGTIDQIDTTDLFAQYDDAFQTWFADIQAQLSGDVATNLQNQINTLKTGKVNVSDKASTAQAQAGTDDTKWMTPAKVKSWWDYLYNTLVLPVTKGGTGRASAFSANGILYAQSASLIGQLSLPLKPNSALLQSPSGEVSWVQLSATLTQVSVSSTSPSTTYEYTLSQSMADFKEIKISVLDAYNAASYVTGSTLYPCSTQATGAIVYGSWPTGPAATCIISMSKSSNGSFSGSYSTVYTYTNGTKSASGAISVTAKQVSNKVYLVTGDDDGRIITKFVLTVEGRN